ncbi:MAG TPA: hypothetical protein VGZ02_03795 [Candidatus Baltobacteraceae bacterium]|nr:hypothetical protein [Candidatus Baltobacteraceae bacterium]
MRYAGMLPDPYAIYAAARAYWETARYPAAISYTVDVRVNEAGTWKTNHYHLTYDALHDAVRVNPVSDEEVANPHRVPPGPNIRLFGVGVGKDEPRTDYLGIPELAPNYSFGLAKYVPVTDRDPSELVREIRDQFHDPAPPARVRSQATCIPEIASVYAYAHDYDITLAGLETIDRHVDYHLKLAPVRAPKRYRLRDLWVDRRTYFTDRLVSDGNFVTGPGPGVKWMVSFANVAGAPYIAQESAQGALAFQQAVYQQATVAFEDLQPGKQTVFWSGQFLTSEDLLQEP